MLLLQKIFLLFIENDFRTRLLLNYMFICFLDKFPLSPSVLRFTGI